MAGKTVGASPLPAGAPSAGGIPGVPTGVRMLGLSRPSYPLEALRNRWEGEVSIWLHISAEGTVVEAKLEKGSGYAVLDDAALRFAETVRFLPARRGATPIATTALLPVIFRLIDR